MHIGHVGEQAIPPGKKLVISPEQNGTKDTAADDGVKPG